MGVIQRLIDWLSASSYGAVSNWLDWLWRLLNSNFSAALAGAGAGAIIAWQIADRSERRRKLLEEIRATNAAINMAVSLVNLFYSLKKQHVLRMVGGYDDLRSRTLAALQSVRTPTPGSGPTVISFAADFQTLQLPPTSQEILQHLLIEKISVTGRALLAFTTLIRSVHQFSNALDTRNSIIEECRKLSPDDRVVAQLYFGIPDERGRTDARFLDCMSAISSGTDDGIFFSKILAEDLVTYGQSLAARLGRDAPRIHQPDFSQAAEAGLIPDEGLYKDWLAGFKAPETPKSWWTRLLGSSG